MNQKEKRKFKRDIRKIVRKMIKDKIINDDDFNLIEFYLSLQFDRVLFEFTI